MSSLPAEKLSQLRQAIHGHISKGNVQEKIRACLTEALAQEGGRYKELVFRLLCMRYLSPSDLTGNWMKRPC